MDIAVIALALAAAGFAVVTGSPRLSELAGFALYLPVTIAALRYGLKGGLIAALAASVPMVLHVPATGWTEALAYTTMLFAGGVIAGMFSEREKRRKASHQNVVRQLSIAHENLQENFEGMKRAERLFALGQLSAGLAHEIRNPLASISGAVGILKRHRQGEPKLDECLNIIDREAARLNKLLTSFLDFARPRAPQFRSVNTGELLEAVTALASHGIGRKSIQLRTEAPPDLPPIECDPEQLQQVLLNLTINAIQASDEGGEVVLRASVDAPGRLLIAVSDQGCGIKPEYIDKLFDPFFTTKENGTGLGLPVAHEIVRQFGGVLSAAPNHDRGMTFAISLPLERRGNHEHTPDPAGR
jgi:signal transduction histidine kinase